MSRRLPTRALLATLLLMGVTVPAAVRAAPTATPARTTSMPSTQHNRRTPTHLHSIDRARRARLLAHYAHLPLSFEGNRGQTDRQVDFLSRGSGYTIFLTPREAVLALVQPQPATRVGLIPHAIGPRGAEVGRAALPGRFASGHAPVHEDIVRLRYVGVNTHSRAVGLDRLPGVSNYFLGRDRRAWRTNVPTYARIAYTGVYRGVDLVYYGRQGRIESDWIVAPQADPRQIALTMEGAERPQIDRQGNLTLHVGIGALMQRAPVAYQEVQGHRRAIAARYVIAGKDRIGFAVGPYDRGSPLVIDPVLSYSTYLGGTGTDYGDSVAVDSVGDAYVTGETASTNFPATTGVTQTTSGGGNDVFISELNPSGAALMYSAYLGGSRYGGRRLHRGHDGVDQFPDNHERAATHEPGERRRVPRRTEPWRRHAAL